MTKSRLPNPTASNRKSSPEQSKYAKATFRKRHRRNKANSDVLVSAVISSDLLTHLHHILQRAEYSASNDGRHSQAQNFAQLRKVLCMDARSMKDASACEMIDENLEKFQDSKIEQKVA
tara:strand:- start:221 stop:577 length:357 start_codon:yes stop_codon:yes gene_type:complete